MPDSSSPNRIEYPVLLTSDTHFTASPDDAYRFDLFKLIKKTAKAARVKTLILGGDVTDAKDAHPSRLVNRVVDELVSTGLRVIINQGNHDYAQEGSPFFGFLNNIPSITFVEEPVRIGDWVFIPHSRKLPLPGLELVDRTVTHCLLHQTFDGARASNGQDMESKLTTAALPHTRTCRYLSGDIHVPQRLGHVEYVGSPYHVHFGDRFSPRMLLCRSPDLSEDVRWEGISRYTAKVAWESAQVDDILASVNPAPGDQLKLVVKLSRAHANEWGDIKSAVQRACDLRGVKLLGMRMELPAARKQLLSRDNPEDGLNASPGRVLERYCSYSKLQAWEARVGEEVIGGRHDA